MDPPLSAAAAAAAAAATTESVESSPRSRHAESWVDEALPQVPGGGKLRLMCSYGGHIFPRPHDKSLCYIGGDTRMVVVERHTSLVDLSLRLSRTVLNGRPFTLKYQLPDEDLDSLISVTTDEDLDNMIEEYDRTSSLAKSSRLRLFLFPTKMETATSLGTLIEDSAKSVSWFVEALNGSSSSSSGGYHLPMMRGVSADSGSVNCLLGLGLGLGLDDDKSSSSVGQIGEESGGGQMIGENKRVVMTNTNNKNNSTAADLPNTNTNTNSNNHINQDVHSMPDSPMLETSSSFGSTSSSPSMANLPPIRVHVEDHLHHPHHHKQQQQQQQLIGGLDESFAQMSVSTVPTTATTSVSVTVVGHKQQQQQQQQQDDGGAFLLLSSPPPPLPTNIGVVNSNNAFVVSDDERSDHGVPTAFRKPPSPHQMLHRSAELPSPDDTTMSRDDNNNNNNNNNNVISHAKPLEYQESVPVVQRDARVLLPHVDPNRDASDPNYRIQIQQHQLQDSGHLMPSHLDQQQFQHHQQFVHAGTHYIHHTTGAVPMSSYYAMQPQQQQPQQQQQQQQHHQHQLDQHHYPMYFMPLRHTQPYNLSMHSNLTDATTAIASSRPPLPPNPTILTTSAYKDQPVSSVYPSRTPTPPKPEIYRTAASTAPQLLHMTAADQHYANYSHQMHHPPQSVASAAANYTYEFTDPAHSQIYYTQPIAPTLPPHYQTITSAAGIPGSEIPVQLPTVETAKQQHQIRTSQPI